MEKVMILPEKKKRKKAKKKLRLLRYVLYKETLIDLKDHWWTFLGSFIGIALIGYLHSQILDPQDNLFLIGSFGASAVLLYGISNSPLSQPRNVIGGHLLGALVGVSAARLFPETLWLSAAISVSLSIVLMQVSKTLHPPGGATALIANIGSEKIKALGYYFLLSPVLSGVLILLLVALIFNNLPRGRRYPANLKKYRTGANGR